MLDIFGIKFKVLNKIPGVGDFPDELIYMSAKDDLPIYLRKKPEIKQYRDKERGLNGVIFTDQGFWATQKEIDKLVKEGKIRILDDKQQEV